MWVTQLTYCCSYLSCIMHKSALLKNLTGSTSESIPNLICTCSIYRVFWPESENFMSPHPPPIQRGYTFRVKSVKLYFLKHFYSTPGHRSDKLLGAKNFKFDPLISSNLRGSCARALIAILVIQYAQVVKMPYSLIILDIHYTEL